MQRGLDELSSELHEVARQRAVLEKVRAGGGGSVRCGEGRVARGRLGVVRWRELTESVQSTCCVLSFSTALGRARPQRFDARLAALAEFDLIKKQSLRRAAQQARARRAALGEASQSVLRDVSRTQQRVHAASAAADASAASDGALASAAARLAEAQKRYREQMDRMYPAWQEQLERDSVRRLERIDRAREASDRRREVARAAFAKEQSLRSLIVEREQSLRLVREAEAKESAERNRQRAALEAEATLNAQRRHEQDEQRHAAAAAQASAAGTAAGAVAATVATAAAALPPPPLAAVAPAPVPAPAPATSGRLAGPETPPHRTPVLTYDWQSVSMSALLPARAETRLNPGGSDTMRQVRLPPSWSLRVELVNAGGASLGAPVEVPVARATRMARVLQLVRERAPAQVLGAGTRIVLLLDGQPVDPDDSVEFLGWALFSGSVAARCEAPAAAGRAPEGAAAPAAGQGQRRQGDWAALKGALSLLTQQLQQPRAYSDLRGSKYGTLGADDFNPADVDRVAKQALGDPADKAGFVRQQPAELLCAAVKLLLRQDAQGLFPVEVARKAAAQAPAPLKGGGAAELQRQHASSGDERGAVWRALVQHWHWLLDERVLSREELAGVFAETLLPPGEDAAGAAALGLRRAIKDLTSGDISVEMSPASPSARSPRSPSERLLGRVDAPVLAAAAAAAAAPAAPAALGSAQWRPAEQLSYALPQDSAGDKVRSVARKPAHEEDDDEEEELVDASPAATRGAAPAPTPERRAPSSFQRFVTQNRPAGKTGAADLDEDDFLF